ncbi:hypothetical protein M514_01118 [Trichuris suis]|uniref:Uncharacterized protein n=1 Tax=Trichuris suis TaxID=68888 RepID=A0A085MZF5_9BILA|nr:hypothetical protein M513_01118 [Trichuris suis]KFD62601.1 hypothetical protein M514_01118 [Trichuris suis]
MSMPKGAHESWQKELNNTSDAYGTSSSRKKTANKNKTGLSNQATRRIEAFDHCPHANFGGMDAHSFLRNLKLNFTCRNMRPSKCLIAGAQLKRISTPSCPRRGRR